MAVPEGLKTPKRIAFVTPAVIAFLAIVAAAIFAYAHWAAKGSGPAKDYTPAEQATGQTPPARGPYEVKDFTEPKGA